MKSFYIVIFTLCSFTVIAQKNSPKITATVQSDSLDLEKLIVKNSFTYTNAKYEGPGWDLVVKEINKAHFVFVGEPHGIAEVAVFTGKLAEVFKPAALVVEIDPYTVNELKKISIQPTKYASYLKANPYAFAFYSWDVEMDLIRQMQQNKVDIWGLNEINFLSLDQFFRTLASEAKSPANKKIALQKAAEIRAIDLPIFGNANKYGDFYGYKKLSVEAVDSLLIQFKKENKVCQKMLNDLKTSVPIFANTAYQKRVNLMKKNLLNYVAPYITSDAINIPKLLFKFGANHMSRTNIQKGYFEVSNFADNLAEAGNHRTLHLLVIGKKGTQNQMAPVDNDKAIIPYDITDGELDIFVPFANKIIGDEWAYFNLIPIRIAIREGKLKLINPSLSEYVMNHDGLIISGKATATRFL
ncbi:hypothetical protein [Flavobacterium sp. '19STA2R22 D10 B1']|uniref:hypothetical protein n=1 Tax=Flavobacterium aerium TaxID=3037261 RepID=UPI00278C4700|nr:hypothetical protein [Flavobacterium sp. '19STA2R22 D10 B1']